MADEKDLLEELENNEEENQEETPIEEDMIDVDAGAHLAKLLRKKHQIDEEPEDLEVIELEEVNSDIEIAYSSDENVNE